ncbi:hypothetical protein DPMN_089748 [Dreissena polymorpha]|uniref:C1q domain-containing protein n=2 Tax=Dreissena polymorpha TaxID=45954 RepID=A0A9D4QYH3_DREPO|nr:hypothetical protein DPMN_089748 [Dreissena polymorpha]
MILCACALCPQTTFCDVTSDIIGALKDEIESMKARITQLEENADRERKIHFQERKQTENQLKAQKSVIQTLLTNVHHAAGPYINTTANIDHHCRVVLGYTVAFTAVKTKDQEDLHWRQPVTFETVIYNRGGGYDPDRSMFIAPQSGVYMFSITLGYQSAIHSFYCELNHNAQSVAGFYGDHGISGSGSQTVVIEVQAGDAIWVWVLTQTKEVISGRSLSSFSGILLVPLYNNGHN